MNGVTATSQSASTLSDTSNVTLVYMAFPEPERCSYDWCKIMCMAYVDLSDLHAKRAITKAFEKVDIADMVISMARTLTSEQVTGFKWLKQRENTGIRRLLSFQGSNFGAPLHDS